jgi:hypothetical protein
MSDADVQLIRSKPIHWDARDPERTTLPRQRRTASEAISAERSYEFKARTLKRREESRESSCESRSYGRKSGSSNTGSRIAARVRQIESSDTASQDYRGCWGGPDTGRQDNGISSSENDDQTQFLLSHMQADPRDGMITLGDKEKGSSPKSVEEWLESFGEDIEKYVKSLKSAPEVEPQSSTEATVTRQAVSSQPHPGQPSVTAPAPRITTQRALQEARQRRELGLRETPLSQNTRVESPSPTTLPKAPGQQVRHPEVNKHPGQIPRSDNRPILGPTSGNQLGTLSQSKSHRVRDNEYNEAFAKFVKKHEAVRSKWLPAPGELQAQRPQFYKEAFEGYIEEYRILKSTYDLEPGEVAWKRSHSRLSQSATGQPSIIPKSPIQIAVGEEQSLFYHYQGFLPPRIDTNTGSFDYHRRGGYYDGKAEIWRPPLNEDVTNTIVVGIHGECWPGKEKTGFGVWFAENSLYNAKKLELSQEWRLSRKYGKLHVDWNDRYNNPHKIGALAATFALDTTIQVIHKMAIVIDHIILCTKIQGFLIALDEWKWVYEYEGWTLTRKKGRDFHDAEHCPKLRKLLGKLTDLRKGQSSIRVSFRFVGGDDVYEACQLARGAKDMRTRAEDGS